jgi:hypothetical protein
MTYVRQCVDQGIKFAKIIYEKCSQLKKKKSQSFKITRYYKNEPLMVNFKFAKFHCYQQTISVVIIYDILLLQGGARETPFLKLKQNTVNVSTLKFFLFF